MPGEHFAFCCKEGRIRKSNAAQRREPREGGRAARPGGGSAALQDLAHPKMLQARSWVAPLLLPVGPLFPDLAEGAEPGKGSMGHVKLTKGRWIEIEPA